MAEFDCPHVCCEPDEPPHEHPESVADCAACEWAAATVADRCTLTRHDGLVKCPCYEDWNDPPRPTLFHRLRAHFGRREVTDA